MWRPISLARLFFVLLATACGYWIAIDRGEGLNTAVLGFVLAMVIVIFEYSLRTVSSKRLTLASLGLLYGLIVASMFYGTIPNTIMPQPIARIACNFLFGYLGMVIALKHADQLNLSSFRFILSNPEGANTSILDTSVIIDGRITDVLKAGFVEGTMLVPTFVIDELQQLSDSSDSLKRNKGRRGLAILEQMQADHANMQIVEKNYPDATDVDSKLLAMGKDLGAQIVTNDFNLQKVASLHGVSVLNVNELADILKPSVYVGKAFPLLMSREGKEFNQAVGYLEDGTMVVVDDGKPYVNSEIVVVVTSILQTNTGRMVFARPMSNPGSASANSHNAKSNKNPETAGPRKRA